MARIHGRNARVYMNIASGGTAEPVAFVSSWSLSFSTDKANVTAFGDSNMVYAAGLPDASGEFSGFYDDATAQVFTAAGDGVARKFYLYPSSLTPGQYFWGTILPDFSASASVDGATEMQSSWNAASTVAKVG
jgi:hypothetical protein